MSTILLFKKIEDLPDTLQKQVSDFVDFLMERYQSENFELNEDFLNELIARKKHILENPTEGTSIQTLKNKLSKKYQWDV